MWLVFSWKSVDRKRWNTVQWYLTVSSRFTWLVILIMFVCSRLTTDCHGFWVQKFNLQTHSDHSFPELLMCVLCILLVLPKKEETECFCCSCYSAACLSGCLFDSSVDSALKKAHRDALIALSRGSSSVRQDLSRYPPPPQKKANKCKKTVVHES